MATTDFFKIGQASGAQAPDITGSFLEGLEAGLKPFAAFEEKKKKADDLTKKYISAIPNVDAINKIPDWMRSDVTNYLASEKKLYADTAKQLAEMDSSDPAYMETLDKLQSIQNNFITLNDQLNQFQEDSKEYFEASDNGNISKGFTVGEAEKYNNTASVFTGEGKLNIQNGQLVFNVDGKNLNYSNGEVGDFYSPDFDVQSGIDGIAALVENDGLKGLQFNETGYARKIQTLLQQGGKERLLSLVYDDDPRFTTAQGLQTPQIMAAINAGELGVARSLIADELMQGIRTTHENFLKQYNDRIEEISGDQFTASFQTDLATTKYIFDNAKEFGNSFSKPVSEAQKGNKVKQIVNELINLNPQSYAGKISTRSEMYDLFLENANAKDTPENRNLFTRQYGDAEIYYDSSPLNININDENDLAQLFLNFAPLSSDIRNYYKGILPKLQPTENISTGRIIDGEFVLDDQVEIDITDTLAEIQAENRQRELQDQAGLKEIRRQRRKQIGLK